MRDHFIPIFSPPLLERNPAGRDLWKRTHDNGVVRHRSSCLIQVCQRTIDNCPAYAKSEPGDQPVLARDNLVGQLMQKRLRGFWNPWVKDGRGPRKKN